MPVRQALLERETLRMLGRVYQWPFSNSSGTVAPLLCTTHTPETSPLASHALATEAFLSLLTEENALG